MKNILCFIALLLVSHSFVMAQNVIRINANFDVANKSIGIEQDINYKNESSDTLKTIFLNDWNNAYSTKKTPLAKRFIEEFNNNFHFAKSKDRGYTAITSISDQSTNDALFYETVEGHPDVVKVDLKKELLPGESYQLHLNYIVVIPDAKFTGYGMDENGEMNLRYWYITPAVYNGEWQYYSNKNLNDLYVPPADIEMQLNLPFQYTVVSELNQSNIKADYKTNIVKLSGKNRVNTSLIVTRNLNFNFVKTDDFTIISDFEKNDDVPIEEKVLLTDKVTRYITENLGSYPHEKLMITANDYKKDPLYGLNQLPKFIRPFPDRFQYELKLLKTVLNNYLDNTLLVNPRKDYWLRDGIQIYFLMKYVEDYYPGTKLLGTLADFWAVRPFHASDLGYNDQYNLFYMQMARTNRDQPLTMPKDSLLKFNSNIASKYKAGVGLHYLDEFVNSQVVEKTLMEFVDNHKLKLTSSQEFEALLKQKTAKDINWFFTDYIGTRKPMDFKIRDLETTEDSIRVTIRDKEDTNIPVSLFSIRNDTVVAKTWVENIDRDTTITIPKNGADRLVLNLDNSLPEFNRRNNYKSLSKSIFNGKPLQFRLIKDVEDPQYNQLFLMPLVEFNNIYDGLTLGAKFYNKTLLRKRLNYKFSPQYALRSNSFTGGGSVFYTHNLQGTDLYNITYGFGGRYNSIAEDAFVTILTPSLTFLFRDKDDFRSDRSKYLNLRYLSIDREFGENAPEDVFNEPEYSVFNLRYVNSNAGLVNYSRWYYDLQFAQKFGKLALNYEYRSLSERNRQFNFRMFLGTFLYNKTEPDSNFFSFALARPTDYLFDYNYLGRAEDSGIFSQQIIIAEGGFKSRLQTPFANKWMATANVSTSIWRYIQAYGDIGLVKNSNQNPAFVYDSGIKLDLVTDYFELYFPVYSNLGWEIAQERYDQRIRIKFTLDPQVLLGLFRRRWY